jgi:hypothetical protein
MGTQLGLRDLVANHCDNFNQVSTIPPRMLPLPVSLVNREEKIRAYWMTEGERAALDLHQPLIGDCSTRQLIDDRGCMEPEYI